MHYIFRSIFLSSDPNDFPKALENMPKPWKNCKTYLDNNIKYSGDIHFIIGPWGSGKSTFISTYLKQNENLKRPHRISLSTATSTDEIFNHLIRNYLKSFYILTSAIICIISFKYYNWLDIFEITIKKNPTISFFITIFLLLFITNKFRIFYIISSHLEVIFGNQLKIIEDYDRGSLKSTEIYNSLIFRNKLKTTYIVVLGYKNHSEREMYVDMGLKLNADITIFDTDHNIIHSIFTNLYKANMTIDSGPWIGLFTARKIISIFTQLNHISQERNTETADKLMWSIFFKEICKELNIMDLAIISFLSNGRSISSQTIITSYQRNMLNSFLSCIDTTIFNSYIKKSGNSSNQGEVFANNLFINNLNITTSIGSTSRL